MSRLWLRCALVDRKTGRGTERWNAEAVPAGLRLAQLSSYISQRYRTPFWRLPEERRYFAREAAGIESRKIVVFVEPMRVDERSGLPFLVLPRLRRLRAVARSLEVADGVDAADRDGNEPWRGPLFDPKELRQLMNDGAARASRAWLTAQGLARQIEAGPRSEEGAPPPAPGLEALLEEADRFSREAAAEAEGALELTEDLARLAEATSGPARAALKALRSAERSFLGQYRRVVEAANGAARASRALAQLALGVNAGAPSSLECERLDRAAVAVLHPPAGEGSTEGLVADGVSLRATSKDGLVVELAGLLCRILTDRGARVAFKHSRPAAELELGVEADDILVATLRVPRPASKLARAIRAAGWHGGRGGRFSRRWPSPVVAYKAAGVLVESFFSLLGLKQPSELVVRVGPSSSGGKARP